MRRDVLGLSQLPSSFQLPFRFPPREARQARLVLLKRDSEGGAVINRLPP